MSAIEQFVQSVLGEMNPVGYIAGGIARKGWVRQLLQPSAASQLRQPSEALMLVEAHWRACHERNIRLFIGPSTFQVVPGAGPTRRPGARPPILDQIFAMPDLPLLDVLEFSKTGSHGADQSSFEEQWAGIQTMQQTLDRGPAITREQAKALFDRTPRGAEPWRQVQDALRKVADIAPFTIIFADSAGLRGIFLSAVAIAQAQEIERIILGVNPEAMDATLDEMRLLGLEVPMLAKSSGTPDYEAAMTHFITHAQRLRLWWD